MVDTDRGEVVLQALHARRSMPKVRSDRPPRQLIEQIIESAGSAPNHHRTEPWRFVVLSGSERDRLGEVMAKSLHARLSDPNTPESKAQLQRERNKPLRAPVVIAVACVPSDEPKVVEIEELAATAAAVEHMLLAAQALGLGAMWRTGHTARDPEVKRFLAFPERANIVAFVYIGYPDLPELPPRARDALNRATWRGWEDSNTPTD